MTTPHQTTQLQITISPITNPADFPRCFEVAAAAFGTQTNDAIWTAFNPGWDTPSGKTEGAARLENRWSSTPLNDAGNPNVVFLKAVISDPSSEKEEGGEGGIIAGIAIWIQASMIPGHGSVPNPPADLAKHLDVESLYPSSPSTQRFLVQAMASLTKQRQQVIRDAQTRKPPAIMALDLCAVDPVFQKRGIAGELVKWGLEEARRRGGLECVTEGSVRGRGVYRKLGFEQQGGEIEYLLDEEFGESLKGMPSNVFMRTQVARRDEE